MSSRTPDRAPALDRPAIKVACPECGSAPDQLCTSHNGTRQRRSDVHQARTAAHLAQEETR